MTSPAAGPEVPAGQLIYAIGDIHGRADLLVLLLSMIDADRRNFSESGPVKIFLGDYIDRGPHSREVVDLLIAEQARADQRVICLLGNHEYMMLDFLADDSQGPAWIRNGGGATLRSYGLEPPAPPVDWQALRDALVARIPAAHIAFLRSLRLYHQAGDVIFVHAGLRAGVPLERQNPQDLIWIQREFLNGTHDEHRLIVHGHIAAAEVQTAPGRLGIDTGAFATSKLTSVRLYGSQRHFIQAVT